MDFGLKDQIRRAAVSIMSNIAEGLERRSRAEFARCLLIAKGSIAEVKTQLYIALDSGYTSEEKMKKMYLMADETGKKVFWLYKYLKKEGG